MTLKKLEAIEGRLRELALAYPGAHEEFPWGDRVIKVRGKIFVFLHVHQGKLGVTTKLVETGEMALMLPFAKPTGYGLGKAGWVSASFAPDEDVPEAMLVEWIDESYRTVAPKKLVQSLPLPSSAPIKVPVAKKPVAKKPVAKKPVAKKPVSRKNAS